MRAKTYLAYSAPFLAGIQAANSTSPSILSSDAVDLGIYQDAYTKAKSFIANLTNAQKISIITGGSVNGTATSFTALENKDGFSGINGQYYVSAFPLGGALAMSWDRDHMEAEGRASGDEFYLLGYNMVNGPVAGPLGRTPYGGRNSEGFSPDPYLTGIAMEKTVTGMNAAGIVTVSRHLLLNEQETNRSSAVASSTSSVYSSNADDKTIHELYLWPWADAVRAGTGAVMCGMTQLNGTLSCQNSRLVNELLKEELGFPGMVVPDVNSQTTSYGSANAGLDFGSSNYWSSEILTAGISNGSFTQARLDDMAIRSIIGYYYAGLDAGTQPSVASTTELRNVRSNHSQLIRRIASESLTLLKNNNTAGGGLPLSNPKVISVFGAHAGLAPAGPNTALSVAGTEDPFEGHYATGGGSGQGSFTYLITPLHALTERARQDGSMIRYIANDTYTASSTSGFAAAGGDTGAMGGTSNSTSSSGGPAGDSTSSTNSSMTLPGGGGGGGGGFGSGTSLSPSFENYASDSTACLIFINSASGEGSDRSVLYHTSQDEMITTVAANCNNTIVVINTPAARLVDNWIENENITAVLYGSMLGQESGNAIVDVLYGDVNPSGKLTYAIAKNETDYPVSICYTAQCDYTEGVYIDYRYFDAKNVSVRYPFGHGLSYTTFEYGDEVTATITDQTAVATTYPTGRLSLGGYTDLFDEVISITAQITNSGSVAGSEVAQLYVSYPSSAAQPPKQLRGFEKVPLEVGETKEVTFSVRRRDVSYWDVVAQQWAIASGTYTFAVGASSRDIRASASLVL